MQIVHAFLIRCLNSSFNHKIKLNFLLQNVSVKSDQDGSVVSKQVYHVHCILRTHFLFFCFSYINENNLTFKDIHAYSK